MSNEPDFKPRRPMMAPVPGPASISQQAIALREASAKQQAGNGPGLTQTGHPPLMQSSDQGRTWTPVLPAPIGNIAHAISSVMSEVGTIEKRGYNEHFRYHFARVEDVLEALTPLMGKHGLAIFQNEAAIKMEGSRMAVEYEFSVIHKSNERWPPLKQTGTAIARDSKGNLDDKAIAKCHTQARKYFLLGLFNVPAGDFPESDSDANGKEKKPVPGPSTSKPSKPVEDQARQGAPHQLAMPAGTSADQWANAYIRALGSAKSVEELQAWDQLNDDYLQRISDKYPEIYSTLTTAYERRLTDVSTPTYAMPEDAQEAMNWVATQLASAKTYEFAEQFWNQYVAPREPTFDHLDWEMLMAEWERTVARLGPPDKPDEAA
jgi:hypothetical protein